MRLYEGNILTCDKENRIAHYLLEDQGKILYCGDELPAGCVAAERGTRQKTLYRECAG